MINKEKAIELAQKFAADSSSNWENYDPKPSHIEHIPAEKYSLVGMVRPNGVWSIVFISNQELMENFTRNTDPKYLEKRAKKYRCIHLCVDDGTGECWESGTLEKY